MLMGAAVGLFAVWVAGRLPLRRPRRRLG
jgi:hypothetical protein